MDIEKLRHPAYLISGAQQERLGWRHCYNPCGTGKLSEIIKKLKWNCAPLVVLCHTAYLIACGRGNVFKGAQQYTRLFNCKVLFFTYLALFSHVQISPFPFDLIKAEHIKYDNAKIVWAQEEPKNMGYWAYVKPRIETAVNKQVEIRYKPEELNYFSCKPD